MVLLGFGQRLSQLQMTSSFEVIRAAREHRNLFMNPFDGFNLPGLCKKVTFFDGFNLMGLMDLNISLKKRDNSLKSIMFF